MQGNTIQMYPTPCTFLIKKIILSLLTTAYILPSNSIGNPLSLASYLNQIETHHPLFKQEALNQPIAFKTQQSLLDEDWTITAFPLIQHNQRHNSGNSFVAEEENNFALNIGLARNFWSNGSHLSLEYDYG